LQANGVMLPVVHVVGPIGSAAELAWQAWVHDEPESIWVRLPPQEYCNPPSPDMSTTAHAAVKEKREEVGRWVSNKIKIGERERGRERESERERGTFGELNSGRGRGAHAC
jgi:predicted phosphoadenosine phosphosulfate sulfurtransferase